MISVMNISDTQETIVQEFESLGDWDARYKHIIELGKSLPPFPEEHRLEENKVKGCQSQVWMVAHLNDQGEVVYQADSDAMIVRGLIHLLLRVYSERMPEDILATKPTFFERLDMANHISMQRSNGLYAMLKQIQYYALAFKMKMAQGQPEQA